MDIDDLLAALPPPGTSRRLDALEEGVWRVVERRWRVLQATGKAVHVILLICILSGACLFARSQVGGSQQQHLLSELAQDVLVTPERL